MDGTVSRRAIIKGAGAAIAAGWFDLPPVFAAASGQLPFIPFPTSLSYYDHGWIQWLPNHPEFEAIEMQVADRALAAGPLVRVFFSRRQGGKSQVFYFNDPELVDGWRVGEAYYAPIRCELTGGPGGPRGFSAELTDKDNQPISWRMGFEGAQLKSFGGGLRPSVGHSKDLIFSLPVRGPTATATSGELRIGQQRYVIEGSQDYRPGQGGGYSAGEHTSLILLSPVQVLASADGFEMFGRDFSRTSDGPRTTYHWAGTMPGSRAAAIELVTEVGALKSYTNFAGKHSWMLDFINPLPSLDRIDGSQQFAMNMSWDGERLIEATISAERVGKEVHLRWKGITPGWLADRPLEVRVSPSAGGYTLLASRLAG